MNLDVAELGNGITKITLSGRLDIEGALNVSGAGSVLSTVNFGSGQVFDVDAGVTLQNTFTARPGENIAFSCWQGPPHSPALPERAEPGRCRCHGCFPA